MTATYTRAELTRHADELMNDYVCLSIDFALILRPVEEVSQMTEEELRGQAMLINRILENAKELGHTTMALEDMENPDAAQH